MDIGSIPNWISIIIAAAALIYTILSGRSRAAATDLERQRSESIGRHEQLASKVERLDDRLATVEGEMRHLPDKDTAHRMEMAIARLEGRLETMDERLKPVAAMASRMQDHLMETAK